uniref:Uncharacterized protein n=1 Tax=Cucumis melo TaxID=3656 RepID=A0A9I9EBL0_CUCME
MVKDRMNEREAIQVPMIEKKGTKREFTKFFPSRYCFDPLLLELFKKFDCNDPKLWNPLLQRKESELL